MREPIEDRRRRRLRRTRGSRARGRAAGSRSLLLLGLMALAAGAAGAVETGDDLVFAVDTRDVGTGLGEAGLVVGEIDQKHTDVRAGLAKTTAEGTVLLEVQLGEPDRIARKSSKTTVKQARDLAMRVRVSDSGATVDETDAARVKKCSLKVTFKGTGGVNSAQNLPDEAKWKLVCDNGWQRDFEGLSGEAIGVLKSVLGSGDVKLKGVGPAVDRAEVLTDLAFPLLD